MIHFFKLALIFIVSEPFVCVSQNASSVKYDESVLRSKESTSSIVPLPPHSDIAPTPTVNADRYLVTHINETLIPYPAIHAFFLLDKKVVEILQNFTSSVDTTGTSTEHRILILKYIEDWKENVCKKCELENSFKLDIPKQLGDPSFCVRIIRRLLVDLPKIKHFTHSESWKEKILLKLDEAEADVGILPENQHRVGYALGIMRLAHVYDQLPQDIFSQSNIKLKIEEITEIGIEAHEIEYYARSSEWFSFARSLADDTITAHHFKSIPLYISMLQNISMFYHDKLTEKMGFGNKDGNFLAALKNVTLEKQSSIQTKRNLLMDRTIKDPNYDNSFRKLCQGKEMQEGSSHLKCRLDTRDSPWLLLMPAKVEEAFADPQILVFHDVLRPQSMEVLRQTAMPIQVEAKIHPTNSDEQRKSLKLRMSFVSWFSETILTATSRLHKKIEALTGMKASDRDREAETFQVNVYGAGGHYSLHRDAFGIYEQEIPEESGAGDRIGTFMIYMNQVESGGRTVFPILGAKVEPVVGSAVFWGNLLPSGETDQRMYHAGCPVNSGTKWVCNRWIRYNAQAFTHPCPTTMNSTSSKQI